MKIKSEDTEKYQVTNKEDEIINKALEILKKRLLTGEKVQSPENLIKYLRLKVGQDRIESFGAVFLNAQNIIIEDIIFSKGTVNETNVYPREICRNALLNDSVSVIIYHNHPSGNIAPSSSDRRLTSAINEALSNLKITLLDHIIVSLSGYFSFKEDGLIN